MVGLSMSTVITCFNGWLWKHGPWQLPAAVAMSEETDMSLYGKLHGLVKIASSEEPDPKPDEFARHGSGVQGGALPAVVYI
jgi:hypothetical protein